MDAMHNGCELDRPYPPPQARVQNPYYASLLQNVYAGRGSELTAICQYSYQTFILGERFDDLRELIGCISAVEMHHLDLLGRAIVSLGGDPLYRGGGRRGGWWSGAFPVCAKNVRALIAANIAGERAAVAAYKELYRRIADENIRALLARIIMDEEHHLTLFEQAAEKYSAV